MAKLVINTFNKKSKINKEIYGHFSEHLGRCIYEGIYVGENSPIPNTNGMRNDVVSALKKLKIPVLRWPGGCFADEYHWKDGIGDKTKRKKMINTHWGGVVEDNSFGTHEFMELCSQLETEPYISGNLGSGTVAEMQEWVEYMTFDGISPMAELRKANGREKPWKVKYFGVGNENWGCGGGMRPEFYADNYRRYAVYLRNFGENKLYKIACGPNGGNYDWTEEVMKVAGKHMHALALHHYTIAKNWQDKGFATGFDEKEYFSAMKSALHMETLVKNHIGIMERYDRENKVKLIVDEWGTWFNVEPGTNTGFLYQQNTMRDALVASTTLDIFNKYSYRIAMANIAQVVNVLQAVILTEGEKMLLTPTYYAFEMYKVHQEAMLLDSFIETEEIGTEESKVPNLHQSVSIDEDGVINITVSNLSLDTAYNVEVLLVGKKAENVKARILTNTVDAHNTFENPNNVYTIDFDGVSITNDGLKLTMPAVSIVHIQVK